MNEKNGRVPLHGVRHTLLERQAEILRLPLRLVALDWTASTTEFRMAVQQVLVHLYAQGIRFLAFGDVSSAFRREQRTHLISGTGLESVFPLWGLSTREHATVMLEAGLSAWVCSVETSLLPADRAGRRFDENFLAALPAKIDPGGENDEFHTFAEWAPGWDDRVAVRPTRSLEVYDFAFAELDLVPALDGRPNEETEEPSIASRSIEVPEEIDPFRHFERLRRLSSHVDDHFSDNLDLAAAAEIAAMSSTGFSRYFRERVGVTFTAWLAGYRVEQACRMLREDNHIPLSRIAAAVGIPSVRTFRRVFREHKGCSPSEYRKKCRKTCLDGPAKGGSR